MQKVDLKKEFNHLYKPSAKDVQLVDVPEMNFLMVDGQGDPNTSDAYREAIEALYPLAYTLKFRIKRGKQAVDYSVAPLEGLWWADDISAFSKNRRNEWKWTLMIMQPVWITRELVEMAKEDVEHKKNPPALSLVRFESFKEGKAAQLMHIGPYSEEAANIEKIHTFIKENGYSLYGLHHEIYLSDPRRTAPEKLKTVIRQPFK